VVGETRGNLMQSLERGLLKRSLFQRGRGWEKQDTQNWGKKEGESEKEESDKRKKVRKKGKQGQTRH